MYKLDELQNIISDRIDRLNLKLQPIELYEPIEYILSIGGKRIRPSLTLLTTNIFTDNIDYAIDPAIGLEVFHNFTLMHDDIMDKADVRRNKQTVHKKWNDNIAILSGDAMMIKSYEFFFGLPADLMKKSIVTFNRMAINVCEGQQYDMNFEKTLKVSLDEYIEMIRLKTAVLLSACMEIGGIIGGAADDELSLLNSIGENIGLAFQLKDDLLDTYGDINKFGKKIGGDIILNKKTFLLIAALNDANSKQLKELVKWIELQDFNPNEKINAIKNIYNDLSVEKKTISKIKEYHSKVNQYIEKLDIQESRKGELISLTERLMQRDY